MTAKTTDGEVITGEYNTVCFAIGRDPCSDGIGLENTSVELAKFVFNFFCGFYCRVVTEIR